MYPGVLPSLLLIALSAPVIAADPAPPARNTNTPASTNPTTPKQPTPGEIAADIDARLEALRRVRDSAAKLRDSRPEEYARAAQDFLESCDAFTANHPGQMTRHFECKHPDLDYRSLANFVRFRLQQPERAITLYARLETIARGNGWPGIADTYEFDLHDKAQAVAAYRHLVAQMETAPREVSSVFEWSIPILLTAYRHQIDYLTSGQRYAGKPTRDQQHACATWLTQLGAGYQINIPDTPEIRAAAAQHRWPNYAVVFRELPTSLQVMHAAYVYRHNVRDPAVRAAYYQRSDPAGFWTACAFSTVNNAG